MSDRCQSCGQPLPSQENQITVDRTTPKKTVDVPEDWFNNRCFVLLRHPTLEEYPKFKEALIDLPKALKKWGKLTEGQYKFFCVIHQKLTGTWPSREDPAFTEPPPF